MLLANLYRLSMSRKHNLKVYGILYNHRHIREAFIRHNMKYLKCMYQSLGITCMPVHHIETHVQFIKIYSLFEIVLCGWPQRQHESCIPCQGGFFWIRGPADEKQWDKPRMKTHSRSIGSYLARTRVRTCYHPFSATHGLVSPTLSTQPQSWLVQFSFFR